MQLTQIFHPVPHLYTQTPAHPQDILSTLPMTTKSQTGSLKPKLSFTGYSNLSLPTKIPSTIAAALNSPIWKSSKQEEYNAVKRNQTWTLVPSTASMNIVDSKWVFRIKHNSNGTIQRYKACLVAQGFHQTPGIDFHETFNLVIKPPNIRLILTPAASYKWHVHQLDINNTWHLQENNFMHQPQGFDDPSLPSHVRQLNKPSMSWNKRHVLGLTNYGLLWCIGAFTIVRLILHSFIFMNTTKSSLSMLMTY